MDPRPEIGPRVLRWPRGRGAEHVLRADRPIV